MAELVSAVKGSKHKNTEDGKNPFMHIDADGND